MIIVTDLDGTLCNCAHRVHLAQAGQWDEFHSRLSDDPLFTDVAEFLMHFSVIGGFEIWAVSGRNERYRTETMRWLRKHDIEIDRIYLRPDNDYTVDHVLKPRMLLELGFAGQSDKMLQETLCVLDDRDKVVEAYRNAGLNCWQVRNGTY